MYKIEKIKFLLMVVAMVSLPAFSGVNYKNGNFYVSYTDIVVPGGGKDLEITRTYNSHSTHAGWFGMGWGSEFETRLEVGADGAVVIHENGSGARTRFTPKDSVNVEAAADLILSKIKDDKSFSDRDVKKLRANLVKDAHLRQSYSERYNVKVNLANGTKLYSNIRGFQTVEKISKGYKRTKADGTEHHFNKFGNLTVVKDKYGYKVNLTYKNGNLASIKDSQAKQLFFEWYDTSPSFIKSVRSTGDKKATYKYDKRGFGLVDATDVSGNNYKYSYDANYNLQKISYSDDTSTEIKYTPKKKFTQEVKDRDDRVTRYKYGSDKNNPDMHYWTTVSKKGFDGKWRDNKYEYEIRRKKDGSTYTYRIFTSVNGRDTETVYSECCGLPLKITQGKDVTTFTYDDGLLTSKVSTRGEMVKLKYNKKLKKISWVKNNEGETFFDYSSKGDLKLAKNKSNQVNLFYNSKGRIVKMINNDKKKKTKQVLEFIYNNQGKPIEIAMGGVGKINVEYDNYGEIKNVKRSKQGHRMALKVTQAFRALLDIVKPAGVNLNI